jgi:ABC-type bacteriocin/lantibiotic exporter with double-glycine peptidase domain
MLFAALGASHDEAVIAQKCGITALGCTAQDLVLGAQAFGFNAGLLPVRTEPDAIAALSNQAPFVAMIDLASVWNTLPMFQWHFVVPLGVSQGAVVFHDPADGPNQRAPLDDFLSGWATAGYRGVRLWTP